MTTAEIEQKFRNGDKVIIQCESGVPYPKKLIGQVGEVLFVAGKFVGVDFENMRDVQYIYWSDLLKG